MNLKLKVLFASITAVMALAIAPAAKADTLYQYGFVGFDSSTFIGDFSFSLNGAGALTTPNPTLTIFENVGAYSAYYPTGTYTYDSSIGSYAGDTLVMTFNNGSTIVKLSWDGSYWQLEEYNNGRPVGASDESLINYTPEPSSLLLLGTGLLFLSAGLVWRFKSRKANDSAGRPQVALPV